MGLLALIPFIGGFIGVLVYYYHVYCAGVTLQASHRLDRGKAQWAVWVPQVLSYLVSTTIVTLVVLYLLMTSLTTMFSNLEFPR
jgi:thiamine transporter ThiT